MKNIAKIFRLAKPLYGLTGIIAFLILIGSLLELVAPIVSKYVVEEIERQVNTGDGDLDRLFVLIAAGFALATLGTVITTVSNRLGDHFGGRLRKFLTEKFYDKVLRLPQTYFDSELSGKIVNQLNRGVFTIQGFANTATNFILPTFLQAIFTIAVMAYFSWQIALLITLLFPIYLYLTYLSTKRWGVLEVKKNKHEDITRGRIQEVISNIKVVKTFLTEYVEAKFISKEQSKINEIYAKQSSMFHILDFIRNFSLQVILLGVSVIVFVNTFQGNLSFGSMVLILQLVNQVKWPLFAMSFILTQIQMAESGSKEFFEVLDLDATENFARLRSDFKVEHATLEFRNVGFSYKDSEKVLSDVSLVIAPQEKIALVGHSGAGKSTIVNLILKFYEPTSGELLMNGKSYHDLTPADVRQNISLVFQDNELFSSTIRENVAYGTEASEEEVIAALKKANAYDFVSKLKKGLDSKIGERGVRLSGGQKQRIQIARAILNDAPILILDEATSSLDSKSEHEVQVAVENLIQDKLVIIIAHRFSTIQNVDRIFVIDQGRIVDSGTPKELSTRKGIYSDLLNYQIEGNKKLLENFEIF